MTSSMQLQKDSIDRRRAKVVELVSKGKNMTQIAEILHVDLSTVTRDYQYVKENAAKNLQSYLTETLPLEITKSISRLNSISDEAWAMAERARGDKEKIAALSLALRAAVQIMNVAANKNVIEDAKISDELENLKKQETKQGNGRSDDDTKENPDPTKTVF